MKFFNLLQKELRELINAQMLVSLVVMMFIFMMMGNIMSSTIEEATKNSYNITLCDRDGSEMSKSIIKAMEESGAEIKNVTSEGDDYPAILDTNDTNSLVIIPEGFEADLKAGNKPEIISVTRLESAAMMSNISSDNSVTISFIKSCVSNVVARDAGLSVDQIQQIDDPFTVKDNTVVHGKSANVQATSVMSSLMMQSEILPIIVFILIVFTSQMLINAISNEKIDKTLETLLSAPVSRTSILGAKMLAAAIIALLNAVFYMVGFSSMMKNMGDSMSVNMGTESIALEGITSSGDAMKQLGLTLSMSDYLLVGLQLFFTIMICLSVSIMLGSLVNDTKSSQMVIMPLMMMAMVPYFISLFADVNSLPIAAKIIVYAIPFTHTFSGISNLMFGHTTIFVGGLIYQIIVFAVCMFFAVRLFKSDKILTMSLNFGQKSRFKKNTATEDQ
ncbi:MAG: ABC transporter permease [Ruminococcus sp.]|nr:ABC transporter permease [Ruminococcus sp.]